MNYLISFLFLLLACTAPKKEAQSEGTYLIKNVNVIDVRDGAIQPSMDVLIEGQKIKAIRNTGEITSGAEAIDGTDKYLMPGLAEMHAHIPSPQWGRDNTEETLFLYLSNGVTTIRGMLGHPVHLELREKAKNNEVLSPRIFTSSPSVNGNSVPSVELAQEKVREYSEDGYDFLKLHPGLNREVFDEIVKVANEVGIAYAGHVSVDVGIRHAISNGYAAVDHVDGYLEGLVPEGAGVEPDQNGFFGYDFTDLADESLIPELVSLTKENKVWIVPTQSLFDRWFSPIPADELAAAEENKYMPKSTVEQWVNSKNSLTENPEYREEKWKKFNAIRKALIKQLNDDGHGMLLGSDAPQVFNVPGFSIHHELKGMIEAGVSPLEAIQSGTLNPAIFFKMEGEFGEVVEGASADLILLDQNPMEDLKNLKKPTGVMVRGQWLDRATIDKRLQEIAERAKNI